MIDVMEKKVLSGQTLTRGEALDLAHVRDTEALCRAANRIRRHFCGDAFDLCAIINGKSGRCSENCKYCAQSICYAVPIREYPLLEEDYLAAAAAAEWSAGVGRFSVVTAGRTLTESETEAVCQAYQAIGAASGISCCASHGLLNYDQLCRLRAAGVRRYHCNLETCRRRFSLVCTTHTYDEKLHTLAAARKAGLELCSGGIIGMGENMADRIDLALELRGLQVDSVPLNVLTPIPGTPYEKIPLLSEEEVCRTAALFRFLLPQTVIRIAAGRGRMADKGAALFRSGINGAITGDMLTTAGITVSADRAMLAELGFQVTAL